MDLDKILYFNKKTIYLLLLLMFVMIFAGPFVFDTNHDCKSLEGCFKVGDYIFTIICVIIILYFTIGLCYSIFVKKEYGWGFLIFIPISLISISYLKPFFTHGCGCPANPATITSAILLLIVVVELISFSIYFLIKKLRHKN